MGANQDNWNAGAALWVPHGSEFTRWGKALSDDHDGIVPVKIHAAACNRTGGATVPTPNNNWGGVTLPNAAVSGVSYARSYPLTWLTALCTWGYVPMTNVSGNIRWRFRAYFANVLGAGSSKITDAPFVDVTFTKAADAQFVMGHVFNVAAAGENSSTGFAMHNGSAFIGEVLNVSIERVGTDALDTYSTAGGIVQITNISIDPLTRS